MSRAPVLTTTAVALHNQAAAELKAAGPQYDGPVTLPRMSAASYAMNNTVNCSALFGTLRTPARAEFIKTVFEATNGGRVTYKGPELRQDDKAVLLELLHQRRNMFAGEVDFAPTTFCAQLGWSRSTDSVERLRNCLARLVEGTLRLDKTSSNGAMFHLLSDFKWAGDKWTATLHEEVSNLFPTKHFAYLNIEQRKQLTAGIQTWLFDYVSANDGRMVMTYAALREACGRPAEDPKQFADYIKAAMARLVAIGAIVKFEAAKCEYTSKPGLRVTKK